MKILFTLVVMYVCAEWKFSGGGVIFTVFECIFEKKSERGPVMNPPDRRQAREAPSPTNSNCIR